MTREEAIRWLEDIHRRFNPTGENLENEGGDVHLQALDMAIEALSAEAAKVAYICDGRKCDTDCFECFRTLDIEHAKDFKLMGDTYYQQPSAAGVHDGCDGCRYEQNTEHEYPCKDCKQNYMDMWEQKPNDSVSVVRCKDCKWYQGVHGVQGHAPCEWFNKQVLWNDFCSNGEPYKGGDTE